MNDGTMKNELESIKQKTKKRIQFENGLGEGKCMQMQMQMQMQMA